MTSHLLAKITGQYFRACADYSGFLCSTNGQLLELVRTTQQGRLPSLTTWVESPDHMEENWLLEVVLRPPHLCTARVPKQYTQYFFFKKKILFEQAFFKKYLSDPLYYSYLVVTAVEEGKLSHNLTGSLSSISSLAHLSQCV